MNICYLNFWGGFDPNCNWFNLMFRELFGDREINFNSSPNEADIIFFSSFGSDANIPKNTKAVKIFYTGENELPRLDLADYSLSHYYDSFEGRNYRLPHWYMYVNWWGEPNFPHARISKERLFRKWKAEEVRERKEFCSIIIGNPVPNRIEVATKLNQYLPVSAYGKVWNRHFTQCKIDLMENFRYNICFENSITKGYVTEKLLEAKVAGCIPLYYGDASVATDFNPKCFINYNEMRVSDEMLIRVKRLESDFNEFKEIAEQPLFETLPDLSGLYSFLKRAIQI